MKEESKHEECGDRPDLDIGGALIGEYMRSSSRWGKVGTIAAIIAAIASVITLIISIFD